MTLEQRETKILNLVHKLPILRRIRLALTILKEVEPTQIPLDEEDIEKSVSEVHLGDEKLAQKILDRKKIYKNGEKDNISRQDLMAKIYSELSPEA